MTLIRRLARPMLATTFALGAVEALKNSKPLAEKAQPVTDPIVKTVKKTAPQVPITSDPHTLVLANAGVQLVAAAALATNRVPRVSATVLAASLVPTTLAGHAFWQESDEEAKNNQRLAFAKNVSLLGGLILAAVDTEGRPGLAWRARRAAADVRRETRHVAKQARREAKLARAQLT
jgi:putative oxidoreductase